MQRVEALTESLYVCPCFFTTVVSQTTVMTEFSTNERKRFLWSVILWQLRLLRAAEEERHIKRHVLAFS